MCGRLGDVPTFDGSASAGSQVPVGATALVRLLRDGETVLLFPGGAAEVRFPTDHASWGNVVAPQGSAREVIEGWQLWQ